MTTVRSEDGKVDAVEMTVRDGSTPTAKRGGFKAPSANYSADIIWELPAADGTANQVLTTDGAGNLSWSAGGGGGGGSGGGYVAGWTGPTTLTVSNGEVRVFSVTNSSDVEDVVTASNVVASSATVKNFSVKLISSNLSTASETLKVELLKNGVTASPEISVTFDGDDAAGTILSDPVDLTIAANDTLSIETTAATGGPTREVSVAWSFELNGLGDGTEGTGVTNDSVVVNTTGVVSAGDAGVVWMTKLLDTETLNINMATFMAADGQNMPTGTSLRIVTLDGIGGYTDKSIIVSGGASHVKDTGTPLDSYQNTSGGDETVAVVVDNGEIGTGTGTDENCVVAIIGDVS